MSDGGLQLQCLRLRTQSSEYVMRRRGWQVRRGGAVQPVHPGKRGLQRQHPAAVRVQRSVHLPTGLLGDHTELRPRYRPVRAVRLCQPVPDVCQPLLERRVLEQRLRVLAQTSGNGLQRRHMQRDGSLPGVLPWE